MIYILKRVVFRQYSFLLSNTVPILAQLVALASEQFDEMIFTNFDCFQKHVTDDFNNFQPR